MNSGSGTVTFWAKAETMATKREAITKIFFIKLEFSCEKILKNGKPGFIYRTVKEGIRFTVLTEKRNTEEVFNDFYTNRKNAVPNLVNARSDTEQTAQEVDNSVSSAAKIEQKNEITKEAEENISFHKVFHGSNADFDNFDHQYIGTGAGYNTPHFLDNCKEMYIFAAPKTNKQ